MVGAAWAAIASNGLLFGISTAVLHSFLSQSASGAIVRAQGAQLDPGVHVMLLAAVATFFTAVMLIYIHLRNGGGGGVSQRLILEVIFFLLCASTGLLDLSLFMQRGPVQAQVLLVGAALQVLPPAAAATLFLAITLIYVHAVAAAAVTAGGGGAPNEQNPMAVELLNVMTLAATLTTGVLSLIAVVLVFNTT